MRGRWGAIAIAWLMAFGVACFSDTDPVGGSGEGTSTTGSDCVDGSRGCPCVDGACNPGLVCFDETLCFPGNCVAGTLACPCLAGGGCDVGLMCEAMQCVPASAGTTTMTTMTTEGGMVTSASTTATETDSNETLPGTEGGLDCIEGDGSPCARCAGIFCCDEFTACLEDPDEACGAPLECFAATGSYGGCGADGGGGPLFNALAECLIGGSSEDCSRCAPPVLACLEAPDPAIVFLECTSCAADSCCDELIACHANTGCSCLEECHALNPGSTSCLCDASMDITAMARWNTLRACTSAASCTAGGNMLCYQ